MLAQSKIIVLITLCFGLWTFNAKLFAVDSLPNHVFLKDHRHSFTFENEYVLRDGRIWIKQNELTTGKRADWTLFEGTGLPHGPKAKSFEVDDRVESFEVEGLVVVAVSKKGRVYFWKPTEKGATVWEDKLGQPIPGPLYLPAHKDWAFSLSVQFAPYKRPTPMHDIDSYYEDSAGNKIGFGFTATIFSLDPSGQVIRYWDTGLPPSWHKAFVTPERGRFVAERIGTSGSAVFVIDKWGRMYTRMYDYEMNGACPGLRFTWDKTRKVTDQLAWKDVPKDTVKDEILYTVERVLPLEDWVLQDEIPTFGSRVITTNISIHMTGEGNAGRELRVQGRNEFGEYGYFWKPILPASGVGWNFKPTGERYPSGTEVHGEVPRELGRKLDKSYEGKLRQLLSRDLDVELVDFHYFNSPAKLRVKVADREFELILHTMDAWGPTVQMTEHPDLVGSPFGEPKLLVGTLEVPEKYLDSKDPIVRKTIDKYFRRFHHVHGAFSITASDTEVRVRSRIIQRDSPSFLDYSIRRRIDMKFSRQLTPDEYSLSLQSGFTALALDPALELKENETFASAISRSQAKLVEIEKIHRKLVFERVKGGLANAAAIVAFYPVNTVLSLLNIPKRSALWGSLSLNGGVLFKNYAKENFKLIFSSDADYERAYQILERRMDWFSRGMRPLARDLTDDGFDSGVSCEELLAKPR
jgi:hypothetical protein